jgi:hypothetical protein
MTTDARWAKAYLDKSEAVETLLAFIFIDNSEREILGPIPIDYLERKPEPKKR